MNHLDLFSGIGGFSLAAQRVWGKEHNIVVFCENDKYCQKVLKKHWPNVPIIERIEELTYGKILAYTTKLHSNAKQYNREKSKGQISELGSRSSKNDIPTGENKKPQTETIDLLTGGWPCQPFSVAGKRKGREDDRYLWHEMFRVIQETKPTWIIGENVTGIIGMELDDVLSDLEGEGYETQTFIIPACAVDAKHRRDRIWIVANAINSTNRTKGRQKGKEDSIQGIDEQTRCTRMFSRTGEDVGNTKWNGCENRHKETRRKKRESEQRGMYESEGASTDVADTEVKGFQGWNKYSSIQDKESRTGDIGAESGNREQGREYWSTEPDICGMAYGLSEKLHQIGGINDSQRMDTKEDKKGFTERLLREMWFNIFDWLTSQRQQSDEQFTRKLADSLPKLPYKVALGEWEARHEAFRQMQMLRQACSQIGLLRNPQQSLSETWESASSEEKDWIIMATCNGRFIAEYPNTPRVAKNIPSRVDRLKALGNAIVPQVVVVIMRGIKEIELDR